mmetsp:Transcript_22093/g.33389  ORF Transcript_22093/g.33389 Transcript_22093/m.33389 type:complete len:214 (-) Transcript_22093:89-730(-)
MGRSRRFSSNESFASLPSLPENEVYTPESLSWLREPQSNDNRPTKKVMAASAFVLCSLALLSVANNDGSSLRRRLTATTHKRNSPNVPAITKRTLLFDDGTLFTPQHGEEDSEMSLCEYLTQTSRRHTAVKQIQLHFDHYDLDDYLGAKLIANSAQVPLVLSGKIPEDITKEKSQVGPLPADNGKELRVQELCQQCEKRLCSDNLHLLQQPKH